MTVTLRDQIQLAVCVALLGTAVATYAAETKSFLVYDGQEYRGDQLQQAARSPMPVRPPSQLANGSYFMPRAADGHFYVPGSINGMPMIWLVDTGATTSVIPSELARNAGIRAGAVIQVDTAAGRARAAMTEGNELVIGSFRLPQARLAIADDLRQPLLGSDALAGFSVATEGGGMWISLRR